jgi:hypothetical protein
MIRKCLLLAVGVGLLWVGPFAVPGGAQTQERPKVQMPQPGVPEIMTMEGRYVRVAYNNEGYAILGYKLANLSVGEPWLMLEVGFALLPGVRDYTITRDAFSLEVPDGKTIPLATLNEYRSANLQALKNRERVQRDSINYFPPNAYQACSLQFFPDLSQRAMPWDEAELTQQRACLGRLYFQVPGGITYGQHWLNVKFANSVVRVPFRILTKEEDKLLSKHYKDIKKQIDEAFRKKS